MFYNKNRSAWKPMIQIEKVRSHHFDEVYGLLSEFHNPHLGREDWRRLFLDNWQTGQDYHGYMIRDGGSIVGYCGYLFSRRIIKGEEVDFCNLTSWIVKPEYRNHSLSLLFPILHSDGYVLTSLTPSNKVAGIKKKLGFEELETSVRILLPISASPPRSWFKGMSLGLSLDPDDIEENLSETDLQIFRDHRDLECMFALIRSGEESCFLVMNRVKRRHLPFLSILYMTHPGVFVDTCHGIKRRLLGKFRAVGLLVDARFLKGLEIKGTLKFPFRRLPSISFFSALPRLYKSNLRNQVIDASEIDNLYSELILLKM